MSDSLGLSVDLDNVSVSTERYHQGQDSSMYVCMIRRILRGGTNPLQRKQQSYTASLFLSLPAEIRNQIYEDVFQG